MIWQARACCKPRVDVACGVSPAAPVNPGPLDWGAGAEVQIIRENHQERFFVTNRVWFLSVASLRNGAEPLQARAFNDSNAPRVCHRAIARTRAKVRKLRSKHPCRKSTYRRIEQEIRCRILRHRTASIPNRVSSLGERSLPSGEGPHRDAGLPNPRRTAPCLAASAD